MIIYNNSNRSYSTKLIQEVESFDKIDIEVNNVLKYALKQKAEYGWYIKFICDCGEKVIVVWETEEVVR